MARLVADPRGMDFNEHKEQELINQFAEVMIRSYTWELYMGVKMGQMLL